MVKHLRSNNVKRIVDRLRSTMSVYYYSMKEYKRTGFPFKSYWKKYTSSEACFQHITATSLSQYRSNSEEGYGS